MNINNVITIDSLLLLLFLLFSSKNPSRIAKVAGIAREEHSILYFWLLYSHGIGYFKLADCSLTIERLEQMETGTPGRKERL